MNVEEILVRMGVDNSGLTSGLRAATAQAKEWGTEFGKTIKSMFTEILAPAAVLGLMYKVFEDVKQVKRASESLSISTAFFQDLVNVGRASGIASEQVEKMLDKFAKGLAPGSDVEESFRALADQLSGIHDPSERARIAIENFGRSGVQMLAVMKDGSKGIDELAAGFSKLSDEEIYSIEQGNIALEKGLSGIKLWAAKATVALMSIGKMLNFGEGFIGFDFSAIEKMTADRAERIKRIKAEKEEISYAEHEARVNAAMERDLASEQELFNKEDELAVKQMDTLDKIAYYERLIGELRDAANRIPEEYQRNKVLEEIVENESKILDLKKKQTEEEKEAQRTWQRAAIASDRARFDRQTAKERIFAPFQATVEELAHSGYWARIMNSTFWQQGPFAQQAQRIQFLENRAHQEFIYDNPEQARRDIEEARGIRLKLEKAGALRPEISLERMQEHMKILAERAAGSQGGVVTSPLEMQD